MNLRPLFIGDTERAAIKKLVAFAEQNVISSAQLLRITSGSEKPVGDNPQHVCVIPVGYRCVFSIDDQPTLGPCRHLSVSVLGDGTAPNEVAVETLAKEFGFRGTYEDMDAIHVEPIAHNKVAVNFLQRKT